MKSVKSNKIQLGSEPPTPKIDEFDEIDEIGEVQHDSARLCTQRSSSSALYLLPPKIDEFHEIDEIGEVQQDSAWL